MGKSFCNLNGYAVKDATARKNIETLLNDLSVVENRMNTFASLEDGSTTADAELVDIRVSHDGKIYSTAGEAVREQIKDVKNDLVELGNGIIKVNGYTYYQRSDNRIWYTNDDFNGFKIGDCVKVNNTDYDCAFFYHDSVGWYNGDWGKSAIADETYCQGVAIRKSDKSDISALTPDELDLIFSVERNTQIIKRINALENQPESEKHYHVSIDDCVFWSDLIANEENYTSCFQNTVLANVKALHDNTGACITLNCFCIDTNNNRDISNVPSKFAEEFKTNSYWLKFAFHAENGNSNYSTDQTTEIKESYDKFVNAIFKMTGTVDCIDRVARLGFYSGSLENIKAIRDADCGIVGLLYRDEDTGTAYYLNDAQCEFINIHGKWFDSENGIMFLKTNSRTESHDTDYQTDMTKFATIEYGNKNRYVEIFTHEYAYYNSGSITRVTNLEKYCEWAKNNGYSFGFAQNYLKL